MPGTELFGAEERKEVNDVMESGVLFRYNHDALRNGHWKSREFEKALADWNGVQYAHACTSGSTAVAIAMASCGIGAGDEVIVPPFTYIATVEGALLAGALPIFAEIDETLCLSADTIRKALTPNTKAVVLVHMCGSMANLDEIVALCEEKNLVLIEDTAQALGGSYKGKALGSIGKMGCFSFDFFKIITCGEGGAVITNDEALYNNAHQFADHGHDHIGDNRGMEGHPIVGFNYRIGELNAAIGVAQMRKLPYIISQQKKHKKAMQASLAKFPQITFRQIPDAEGDASTFLDFFLPDEATAKKAVQALKDAGVPAITGVQYWWENNYHYIRNWEHIREMKTAAKLLIQTVTPPQDYKTLQLPQSDAIISRLISLVVKVAWTEEQLQDLCAKMEKAMQTL
ncbi:MAG: DegT/DnrJ/EryC1/StrS family aminotransferase [Bacteroidetes bacterium]|nr:MAG: DegT/DnrJ/EryC1/StrS family aminotransferase [Bacteroidota bacterium]